MAQEIYYGAIVIFYKKEGDETRYLVVENAKSGNITFLSGAQEGGESLLETAQREVNEELGLDASAYSLHPTEIYQNFIFDENKKERAGAKGSYRVFTGDLSHLDEIKPTKELKQVWWKTANEILAALTFPDLKEIFQEYASQH